MRPIGSTALTTSNTVDSPGGFIRIIPPPRPRLEVATGAARTMEEPRKEERTHGEHGSGRGTDWIGFPLSYGTASPLAIKSADNESGWILYVPRAPHGSFLPSARRRRSPVYALSAMWSHRSSRDCKQRRAVSSASAQSRRSLPHKRCTRSRAIGPWRSPSCSMCRIR